MNEPIKHQIISKGGKPLFVLVPYETYLETMYKIEAGDDVTIPHEVVELSLLKDKSPIRAWREYKKLSQRQMAQRIKISQSAYSQMEKADAQLRPSTLGKIAAALGIEPEQLDF